MKPTKSKKLEIIRPNYNKHGIYSVSDIERNARGHFFSPETMKFFSSRVCSDIFPGSKLVYFVTSEKNYNGTARAFTVRSLDPKTGSIDTVSEFLGFDTKASAMSYALNLASEEK